MQDLGETAPVDRFLEALAEARSNISAMGNGADVYRRFVQPQRATPSRIAADLAIASIADDGHEGWIGDYLFYRRDFEKRQHWRLTLTTGSILLNAATTGMRRDCGVAALHMGGLEFYCVLQGIRGY